MHRQELTSVLLLAEILRRRARKSAAAPVQNRYRVTRPGSSVMTWLVFGFFFIIYQYADPARLSGDSAALV
jgi:hypothetical protein